MSNKPTHYLKSISGEGDKARFTTLAPLWETKSGEGWTGEIPAGLAVSGRIGVFPIKREDEAESE